MAMHALVISNPFFLFTNINGNFQFTIINVEFLLGPSAKSRNCLLDLYNRLKDLSLSLIRGC